jgi:5-methylcytosine-specific restriction endonuclease McrA
LLILLIGSRSGNTLGDYYIVRFVPIKPANRKRYPGNWPTIRTAILARSNGFCEGSPTYPACRARNGAPHPVTGSKVILTIAHLDQTPENCAPDNLLALCQRCHLTYDARLRIAGRKSSGRSNVS